MNIQKVQKAVDLQNKANHQIDVYGQCSEDVMDELIEIADSFTAEEDSKFIELMYQTR